MDQQQDPHVAGNGDRPDGAEPFALGFGANIGGEDVDAAQLLREAAAAGPGLVRLAATASWRLAGFAGRSYVNGLQRVVKAAANGESVTALVAELTDEAREALIQLIGDTTAVLPIGEELRSAVNQTAGVHSVTADPDAIGDNKRGEEAHELPLRERGAQLLRQSADVEYDEHAHPAYHRILDELAPDEARILRLLAADGPQPAVDVRTSSPLPNNSETVAQGLNMIGSFAGVRYVDRVPAYLNNLYRLGLVWFSREPLQDLTRYQVLEAQPDVIEAIRSAGRAKTVRRSITLTPMGRDFVGVCLPEAVIRKT